MRARVASVRARAISGKGGESEGKGGESEGEGGESEGEAARERECQAPAPSHNQFVSVCVAIYTEFYWTGDTDWWWWWCVCVRASVRATNGEGDER